MQGWAGLGICNTDAAYRTQAGGPLNAVQVTLKSSVFV